MAIMKLFSKFFSNVKTIKRAIQRSKTGEQIKLSPKVYRESIHFDKDVLISANGYENNETIIEGIIIVPKSVQVTIQNVTISPTSQIYVEGQLKLENCRLIGNRTNVLLSSNGGQIFAENCELNDAKEVAVALMNRSNAYFKDCIFQHNGKMHMLIQESEVVIEQCELSYAKHCFWVKDNALIQSNKNTIHHHSGTQIIIENSIFNDYGSTFERSDGNGIYASNQAEVNLQNTTLRYHQLPQIWIQESILNGSHCIIQHGNESGIMVRDFSEANLYFSEITHHNGPNIHVLKQSRLNIEQSHIHSGKNFGVQIQEESIANLYETIIKQHTLSQIYVTEESICSMKNCFVKNGSHVGIFIDKKGNVSMANCEVSRHENSAITVIDAKLNIYESEVLENRGNGILAIEKSNVDIEQSRFYDNEMPHIACKTNAIITIVQSELFNGKSIYAVKNCEIFVFESNIYNCDNIQVEICDHSTALFENCTISNGGSYGIKITRNSIFNLINSQISNHTLAQLVVNDSSLIVNNCELIEGKRNGLLIQNHSEVFIKDSYISKHSKPQIWIDYESTVDLDGVQITEGQQSDLLAQNRSAIYVSDSIIRNDKYQYNVQAMNYSKIELNKTIVENKLGEVFYSENNSLITTSLDEMD